MEGLEHKDLTPFEYACQLGNLSSLKLILSHQPPQDNNPIYLNGLLLGIEFNQTEVVQHLIQQPNYRDIIENNHNFILQHIHENGHFHILEHFDDILEQDYYNPQIQLPLDELKQSSPLDISEQIVLKDLIAYYQSTLCHKTHLEHLHDIRDQLSKRYQTHPISFSIDENNTIELPLSWESFQFLKFQYPEDIHEKLVNAYLNHPIHTAWRFFLNHNPWSRNHNQLNAYHSEIQWLIILMWFVAHDLQLLSPDLVKDIDERIELFISELANLQNCPMSIQELQKFLINSVLGHPLNQILNSEKLYTEHQAFLKQHWSNYFQSLRYEDILHAQLDWSHFVLNPHMEPPITIQACHVSDTENLMFEDMMAKKWGDRWTDNLVLIKESRQKLLSSNIFIAFNQCFQAVTETSLNQAKAGYYSQFNFFYNENPEEASMELDHHHKIN